MREPIRFEREVAELEVRKRGGGAHLFCGTPSPWPDKKCADVRPSADLLGRRINRLVEVIGEGIATKKPHASEHGATTLFDGGFDWHSAVHGHWALLCIARLEKKATLSTYLKGRLTEADLKKEVALLAKKPAFERPYGRAWFLLMLSELERHAWRPKSVATMRAEIEKDVCKWLEKEPYPEKGSSFVAAHESWLFAYLLTWLAGPSANVRKVLEKLFETKVEPARAALAKWRHANTDFLYLPAVQAVLDRVVLPAAKVPSYPPQVDPPLLAPPIADADSHAPGAAVVRVWPHALDAGADEAACARFHTRYAEIFSRPDQWADTFAVSHWVPQFIWMGLWLEKGRP